MFKVKINSKFCSAHSLKGYDGVCKNIHGHNWTIEAEVKGKQLDNIGILIDFTTLQEIVDKRVLELDHINLNDHSWFKKDNPTSENIAR
ncbi:MAG: 6-carboxytetrahydropterin synthase, partial [Nitrospinae bacterium]|nr:6-carboxytetrahydropterin synthase [Nitrospinota bacterium]